MNLLHIYASACLLLLQSGFSLLAMYPVSLRYTYHVCLYHMIIVKKYFWYLFPIMTEVNSALSYYGTACFILHL